MPYRAFSLLVLLTSTFAHPAHQYIAWETNDGCTSNIAARPTTSTVAGADSATDVSRQVSRYEHGINLTNKYPSTISPTESTGASESSTSAFSSQCPSTPINGCANSNYIIARSLVGCEEGSSSSIMSAPTMTETATTSSTTTSASAGATVAFAEDTFYRLSNKFLSADYSLAIKNEYGILSRKLDMTISGDDGRQYWQIKRIPDADDRYWFACQFLGKDVRLLLDPSDRIRPLMAAADDTAMGQQWNVKSVGDGTWRISNVLGNSGAQLSTYSDTYGLFMDMEHDTGTVWSIAKVGKITAADDFL
ncbi:hypothetical protein V500_05575 [Pseudogymnoascus sp. VKM F-4518 (FW-2643)]|nr:hypothetical protein V500_05575 [Pseudogymnoascus sp. VKM F-4518 (FW-2643)]